MNSKQEFIDDLKFIYTNTGNLAPDEKEHIYWFTKALAFMIKNLRKEKNNGKEKTEN